MQFAISVPYDDELVTKSAFFADAADFASNLTNGKMKMEFSWAKASK
jgi:hypothetical protein